MACRLTEKVYLMGHQVYLHTESRAHTSLLDDLLWTYKAGAFLPHAVFDNAADDHPPILIGHDAEPPGDAHLLINLSAEVPAFFSRFERVAEMIDQNDANKKNGRERFRFYRDRGYSLKSHQL
jgi:DNA polymerase-3 subunit chi